MEEIPAPLVLDPDRVMRQDRDNMTAEDHRSQAQLLNEADAFAEVTSVLCGPRGDHGFERSSATLLAQTRRKVTVPVVGSPTQTIWLL